MPGVRQRHANARGFDAASLVRSQGRIRCEASPFEPPSELQWCHYRRPMSLPQREGVADVVAVAVGDDDQVDTLRLALR